MRPQPDSHLRVARPSRDLQAAERFWAGGLGLSVLYRADSSAEGGQLYLDGEADKDLVRRLIQAGGTRVPARNPYWDRWGVTIADPDGYRLVLSSRSWPDDGRRR